MKKATFTIIAVITLFLIVVQNTSCTKKDVIVKTITDTLNYAVDTNFVMKSGNWGYFSFSTLSTVQSSTATYFNQNDTLVALGQGYRLGGRLQTMKEFNINGKVVYYKWKVLSGGQFAAIVPQLKYDPNTTDNIPPVQNVDFVTLSTHNSYNGSVLIQDNTWYFTRIAAVVGTNNYECTTSINNYSNLNGTTISTQSVPVYTKSGYIAIRMGDCYSGAGASFMLAECKIATQ